MHLAAHIVLPFSFVCCLVRFSWLVNTCFFCGCRIVWMMQSCCCGGGGGVFIYLFIFFVFESLCLCVCESTKCPPICPKEILLKLCIVTDIQWSDCICCLFVVADVFCRDTLHLDNPHIKEAWERARDWAVCSGGWRCRWLCGSGPSLAQGAVIHTLWCCAGINRVGHDPRPIKWH